MWGGVSVQSMGEMGKDFCPNFLQPLLENIDRGGCNDGSQYFTTLTENADPLHRRWLAPWSTLKGCPVSLISIICKIFERILKRALLSILSDTRSISPHQQGFLPRRSCLSNLLVFEEAVTRMMDEGHTVDVIYLDFAKAFDSVNHRFLLAEMSPSILVMSSCAGLKHTFLVGSRECTSVENTRGPFQCTAVFRRAP